MAIRAQWNDDEDEALRRLPWRARVVYLQGIRRYMDYQTGWSGKTRILSYQFFFELLECADHTTAPDPKVSKDGLRAIFTMLERVGLVEWPRGSSQQRGVVFRCLLADTDQSVQKQDAPKTHPRRTQQDAPVEASVNADSGEQDAPKTHPCCTREDAPPPESGIREEDRAPQAEPDAVAPKAKSSRGSRLSISELPDDWRAFVASERPDLDPHFCWQKFHDYWVAVPGQKGVKLDWFATWRNFVRSEYAKKVNGSHDAGTAPANPSLARKTNLTELLA